MAYAVFYANGFLGTLSIESTDFVSALAEFCEVCVTYTNIYTLSQGY